ncbi:MULTISPECIES: NrfD/PsrC family molybdoenzyme membrane anchor subunit [unclassified Streptomyces]|uniref:NrfD/PsrC family molybdoenzyme membrane anchor subunit n=1 Tax=unclassified Streptomyces TaxID=2593676 RepID=UPI0033306D49
MSGPQAGRGGAEGRSGGGRAGREAPTGGYAGRKRRRRGRGEQPMVPDASFSSYYGRPVLNKPTWKALDIAGYLYLGGLAGASSLLAAGGELTGRPGLAAPAKVGAAGAISLSLAALVHDLGRPARFLNMLRVFKPTSPMSVGSWLLVGYAPLTMAAAAFETADRYRLLGATAAEVARRHRLVGSAATVAAAVLGPAVATYTAVLLSDTAVPSWHEGYRQLPFVFAGSAAAAASGLALATAPVGQAGPARRTALLGAGLELGAFQLMKRRMGITAEPFDRGRPRLLLRACEALTVTGAALALLSGRLRDRRVALAAGTALLTGSAALRFGVFHAGVASAEDPRYTVVPQRERLRAQGS